VVAHSRPPRVRARHLVHPAQFLCVLLVLVLVMAGPAWAAATLPEVIANGRNWIMGILAGAATLFLTTGGLRYLMAGGDPGEVEKAKTALRNACYGYGLAVLAPVIVEILKSIVGA
jgi:apolipoprotein N-acyltransferase